MMTNTQLLLPIGDTESAGCLSWITNNNRLSNIERRLDGHDLRFNEVISNNHKDALEIMRTMTALHERIAAVETKQNSQIFMGRDGSRADHDHHEQGGGYGEGG